MLEVTRDKIKNLLTQGFGALDPNCRILVNISRLNKIHIVIISDLFEKKSLSERDDMVWPILETLPDEEIILITLCLLITYDETLDYFPEETKEAVAVGAN
jgi:hypothetical protein